MPRATNFTLTNRVIYLGDVSSQNRRMDGSGVCYEQLGVRASLISRHWILHRDPPFWGEMGKCHKNVRVLAFGESS